MVRKTSNTEEENAAENEGLNSTSPATEDVAASLQEEDSSLKANDGDPQIVLGEGGSMRNVRISDAREPAPEVAVYEDKDARARGDEDVDVIDGPAPEGVPAANKTLAEVFEEGRQVGAYGHAWGTYGPNPYA